MVRDFLSFEAPTPDHLQVLAAGIGRLGESYSEAEHPDVTHEKLGSHYRPVPPETYKSWLAEIAGTFRRTTEI